MSSTLNRSNSPTLKGKRSSLSPHKLCTLLPILKGLLLGPGWPSHSPRCAGQVPDRPASSIASIRQVLHVEALLAEAQTPAAVDARDKKQQRPAGRPPKEVSEETVNNVDNKPRPRGNSQAATLRRLRKSRPDLHAKVLAGELSANAAAIEAGFRKKMLSVPVDMPSYPYGRTYAS